MTRSRARNFYYGLRLTPEPRRSALYAIYAWSRLGDDIADGDGPAGERKDALAGFAERTESVIAGDQGSGSEGDALWLAFGDTLRRYPIDPAWLRQMISGFANDLDFRQPADDEDLSVYCDRVAGTVGRMCIAVWGVAPGVDFGDAAELASRLGFAFQMTNILRDFAEDFDLGRVYLPSSDFDREFGPQDLRLWANPERCRTAFERHAAAAANAFGEASPLVEMVRPDCRPVLTAMTGIYSGLLARLRRRPELLASGGVSLRPWTKAGIALRAVIAGRRAPQS